ncbi:hypothetical protein KSX_31320 [Ktedonospora formicarum]|uniref:DZANK-type domain-containing protein n=2 Tax=Ktedonospora formicarum TaxID=2778364 RepID=A0A8J3HWC4_9CHLR|nr:hypothetical protein KSX_31320 [Ktedonospora formicarum]
MLFEALTGYTPFRGDNYPALAHSHIYEAPPRPTSINPAIPAPVEHVILTALMKNPQQRYQRASDMADAMNQALSAVEAASRTPVYPPPHTSAPAAPFYPPAQPVPGYVNNRQYPQPSAAENRQAPLYPCHYCQHLNKPNMRFCTRCGTPMNPCPTCGAYNPANNRFCSTCGKPLAVPM